MRLGFWNRLAVVAGVLFTIISPTWLVVSTNLEYAQVNEEGYSSCIKGVGQNGSDLTFDSCRNIWLKNGSHLGFDDWLPLAGAYAALSVFIYVVLWLAVWIIKWIMRGRHRSA